MPRATRARSEKQSVNGASETAPPEQEKENTTVVHTVTAEIGGRTLSLETGRIAQQAGGAVVARYGDTVVLVTATTTGRPREGIDFFPLTIDFEEREYAVGVIPGSVFRREGRPSTESILDARLTDRALRPRFPKGFRNE
ncbi:MAG: hypothetical protein HYX51_07070, partial [Chloroflexi bacterium]|nr:hypothetical protein [Chloroflexota bacterium]